MNDRWVNEEWIRWGGEILFYFNSRVLVIVCFVYISFKEDFFLNKSYYELNNIDYYGFGLIYYFLFEEIEVLRG